MGKWRKEIMSWKENVKNWDGKLYKALRSNKSCHGGYFEWFLPKNGNPGDWTPVIGNVKMCEKGYHLTTHYAHWSDRFDISVYEAEWDVIMFDGYDKVVCSKARLLRKVKNPFSKNNRGYKNSGHNNSGNLNFGICNSGNWNYGNFNSGYFCITYTNKSNKIFNKSIPENWELNFSGWMYFDLLLEGYHTSWKKAFENANVEGIEELLNLPNFNYEIFERITSITKEQIEEKLNIII